MAIAKRKRPKKPPRKLPSPHERKCNKFYNRLQRDTSDEDIRQLLFEITELTDPYHVVETILRKFDAEVRTHQINYPSRWNFEVTLRNSRAGYVAVTKTSTRLWHATMLAYVELCKHAGKFL